MSHDPQAAFALPISPMQSDNWSPRIVSKHAIGERLMPIRSDIIDGPIDTNALIAEVAARENGAALLFLGITRDHHEGRAVTGLEYTCYREMAAKVLDEIAREIAAAHAITHMAVVHRVGHVAIGETSLAVAIGTPHRAAAYEASCQFVDRLKRDVPIWKRESFADGSTGWVEGCDIRKAAP